MSHGRSYEVVFPLHVYQGQREYCEATARATVAAECKRDGFIPPKPFGPPLVLREGDDVVLRWTFLDV